MNKIWSAVLAAGRISILAAICIGVAQPVIAKQPALKANRIAISYVPPTNPAHQRIYELMRFSQDERVLLQAAKRAIQLHRPEGPGARRGRPSESGPGTTKSG